MKGLAITILLAAAELAAMAGGRNTLLTDGPEQLPPIRREEAGIQSEILVDAERDEIVELGETVRAADMI